MICRSYVCPPSCPSYRGISIERGHPLGQCEECGGYVYKDDDIEYCGRVIYCAGCTGKTALDNDT